MEILDPSKMTRVRDLPEKLSVSRSTVYGWFRRGLKRVRLGGTVYVTHEDLARFQTPEVAPAKPARRPRKLKAMVLLEAMETKRKKNAKRRNRAD